MYQNYKIICNTMNTLINEIFVVISPSMPSGERSINPSGLNFLREYVYRARC